MRIYRFFTVAPGILVILLSLQSCFVAKEYQRPDRVIDDNLFRTDELPEDSLSMAKVSWKEVFTDSLLAGYIEKGLQNNLDIRIALQQIVAAQAYLKQGKAAYFPTLSGKAQATHQELSRNSQFGSFFNGALNQYELSGGLSWEADIWGKIRSNKRAFEASYLQSVAAHQAVKTRLISSIASAYYQLLALDEQKRITEQTIANRQKGLETTEALKEAGSVTEVAVQQTEAQLHTAELLLIDINNSIRLLENSLCILLAEPPHIIERGELEEQNFSAELKLGVPVQLLSNRPDIMAAEYGLIQAFELENVARSNFYPSLQLSATGGYQSLQLENWLDPRSLFFNITGSLTQPIFNGRRIRTQYEVAKSQQEQALLNFRKAILTAGREVSDALSTYRASTEKIAIKQREYEAYQKASTYSEELLSSGFANYLEVLNARENSLNSQLGLIDIRYQQLNSLVQLYTSLGGGWR